MRSVLQKTIGVVLFVAILLVSIIGISNFLDKTDVDEKYKQFFAEENNFDVIFMGTSHTYNTILPQEMWKDHGIPSYNWGQSNCTIPIDYYVLRMLCEYTSPKLVVIDLYGLMEYANIGNGKYRTDARDQQRVQFDAFPLSRLKIDAVYDIFDDYEQRWDFLFKLAIYHNRWDEITKHNFEPRNIPQKGAAFVLGVHGMDYTEKEGGTPYQLEAVGMDYLEQIINFCSERQIQLLFTYLPFVADESNADTASAFDSFFTEYPNCDYINMLNLGIVDYRTDVYSDASHLNYIGAVTVTDWLGEYIAEHYPSVVHADDSNYVGWNDDYDEYVDYKISRFTEGKLYDNLQLLYGNDFHGEIIVSIDEQSMLSNGTINDLLSRLGDRITVTVDPLAENDNTIDFSVTDLRSGETVFTSRETNR